LKGDSDARQPSASSPRKSCGSVSVVGVFLPPAGPRPSPVQAQTEQSKPPQIDGPVIRAPVTPQVRPEDLKVLAPRHAAPQWRPGDPIIIIEDMKERLQPAGATGAGRKKRKNSDYRQLRGTAGNTPAADR
jgi:hypothetical protein